MIFVACKLLKYFKKQTQDKQMTKIVLSFQKQGWKTAVKIHVKGRMWINWRPEPFSISKH